MKKDTHPKWFPNAKVVCEGQVVMTVGATVPEIRVDIWSGTHPFYTGQQRLLDTEGQVDRFLRRLEKREAYAAVQQQEMEKAQPENMSVAVMDLGKKVTTALEAAGATTVGSVLALLNQGEDALLAISGVGQKALIDIRRYLRAEGLIE